MGMYIHSSGLAQSAIWSIQKNGFALNKSLERLSTGFKINRAADGPAALFASESMRAQIRGMAVAQNNVQQGLSMLNVADGAMMTIYEDLQRIREIAVEGSNGTLDTSARAALTNELAALAAHIDDIAANTKYGGKDLLTATGPGTVVIQTGANSGESVDISSAFATATAAALGVTQLTVSSTTEADTLLGQVDTAMDNLSDALGNVGAYTNVMENQLNFLAIGIENYTAAEATIRNTDIATETANLTRLQILQQAGVSALSQANSSASIVLRLLG